MILKSFEIGKSIRNEDGINEAIKFISDSFKNFKSFQNINIESKNGKSFLKSFKIF